MTIKYAARGISTQMRTAEELLFTDGVTLKPVNGGDVFVEDDNNGVITVGTNYNASTHGCTINGTVYESDGDLEDHDYYVVSSVFSVYYLTTETLIYFGYNNYRNEYLTPDYFWVDPDDLIANGCYLTDTVPTQTPVWKISDGTAGTRYTGSNGDAVVKKAGGGYNYYDSVSECDAVWTTEEPSSTEFIAYLNADKTAKTVSFYRRDSSSSSSNSEDWVISKIANRIAGDSAYRCQLYDASGNSLQYDDSKAYEVVHVETTYNGTIYEYDCVFGLYTGFVHFTGYSLIYPLQKDSGNLYLYQWACGYSGYGSVFNVDVISITIRQISLGLCYSRPGSYQEVGDILYVNNPMNVYAEGESSALLGDSTKDYILVDMEQVGGTKVFTNFFNCGLCLAGSDASGTLKICNKSSSQITWCKARYRVENTFKVWFRTSHVDNETILRNSNNVCYHSNGYDAFDQVYGVANGILNIIGVFKSDGTEVTNVTSPSLTYRADYGGKLWFNHDGDAITAAYVEFSVTIP